jgi:hypothetical protein
VTRAESRLRVHRGRRLRGEFRVGRHQRGTRFLILFGPEVDIAFAICLSSCAVRAGNYDAKASAALLKRRLTVNLHTHWKHLSTFPTSSEDVHRHDLNHAT